MKVTIDVPDWVADCHEADRPSVAAWCFGAVLNAVAEAQEVTDELQAQLATARDNHAQVAQSIQDVNNRRHRCNTLVNPGFGYQDALRRYGLNTSAPSGAAAYVPHVHNKGCGLNSCTSDDPNNHQGDTCPVHEGYDVLADYDEPDPEREGQDRYIADNT